MTALKIVNYLTKSKWLNRLALYFMVFIIVISFCQIFCLYFGFLHTDIDSARYMLSTLVQSEAAIVAIVITLSLVAVQLVAVSYSPRVVDIFKKNPDFWLLILIYGIAIFYGLGVLKMIGKNNVELNYQLEIENFILFAYSYGIFTYLALILYIKNTFNLLKPFTIIKLLSEEITKSNILSTIKIESEMFFDKDPVQPINDIIRASSIRNDFETAMIGSRAFENKINYIFHKENLSDDELKKILKFFSTHLRRLGKISSENGIGDSTMLIMNNLCENGIISIKELFVDEAWWAVFSIGRVGEAEANQKMEITVLLAAKSLGKIGIQAIENKLNDVIWLSIFYLEKIGEASSEQKLENSTIEVISSINQIVKVAIENKFEITTYQALESLNKIKNAAFAQNLDFATQKAGISIYEINKAAKEQDIIYNKKQLLDESMNQIWISYDKVKNMYNFNS